MAKTSSIEITLSARDLNVKKNLDAISQSVKKLGIMTETSFAKQNMGVLGVKNFADVKAEMAKLTTAYRDLAGSGKASTGELSKALDALREKQRALYASISSPPKLAAARSVLGITSQKEVTAEISKVKQAYADLASSGKLSLAELAAAKVAMGSRIDDLRSKTNNWRDALGQIKGKAIEAGAALAGMVLASKAAISFESAMADVRKTVGGTPSEIAALGDELLKLSRTIPISAVELAKIAAAGGQLGIAAQDILPFVEVTAKMATAFDMTAEEAGTAIGKLKNVFSLSVKEISDFGDSINQLGNTSAAREKDIVDVMLRVGGTSRQFGLAKEQTAALATAMLSLGKPPEVAATSINTLLNRMQTATMQSADFQDALAKIGTSAEDMANSVASDPQQAIETLLATLAKLDGRDRAEVLTGLFGREFQDDIAVLVGGLKTYKDALREVADQSAFAGAMQKEFEVRAGTTANKLQTVGNVIFEIGNNIGEGFLPIIKAAAEVFKALLSPIADLTSAFPRLSAAIVGLSTGFVVFSTAKRAVDILKVSLAGFEVVGVASMGKVGIAAKTMGVALMPLGKIAAAFAIGWEIGTLLNKFDVVKKAGVTLAHTLTMGWLKVKQAWEWMTGGDTSAVEREMEIARTTYTKMIAEINSGSKQSSAGRVKDEKEVTAAVKESASQQKKVTGEALEAMKKQYQDYASKVRDLQDQIAGHQKSVAAQLREMSRSGMSDVSAWKDQKKEAEEYMAAAKQAAAAAQSAFSSGDTLTGEAKFKEAHQYAEDARAAYAKLNTEVKDGERVVITSQQALKTSFDGVKQAGALGFEILTKQEAAAKSFMDGLKEKSGFADLTEGMSDAEKKWLENWQNMSAYTLDKIKEIDLKLDEVANKKRTAKLVIDYEDGSRSVSSSSYSKGGRIGAYRNGGMIQQIQALASGGGVRNILAGGRLPGFGGGDRRLLLGEDGEVMLNKYAVKAGGLRAALAFNAGRFDIVLAELSERMGSNIGYRLGGLIDSLPQIPQRLAAGGPVASASTGELANFGTINLNLGNGGSAPMITTRESARNLMRELTRMQQRSSR